MYIGVKLILLTLFILYGVALLKGDSMCIRMLHMYMASKCLHEASSNIANLGLLSFRFQISDLLSILAPLYFQEKIPVTLTYVQASILFCMGLQNQDVSYVEV